MVAPRVLTNLGSTFVLHLVKTLENKIYLGQRKYHSPNIIVFPPIECRNYGIALLRLKPAVFYEISKAGVSRDNILVALNLSESMYEGGMDEGYDYFSFEFLSFLLTNEVGRLYFGIMFDGIEFSPVDFPHSWEYGEFDFYNSRWGDPPLEEEAHESIWDIPLITEEDVEEDWTIKNDISSFREEECVVCKDSIPNIMFCNCGHITVCEGCNNDNLKICPVCRTSSRVKRRI